MQDLYHQIDALPVLLPLWSGSVAVTLATLARQRRLTTARVTGVLLGISYVTAVLALTFFPLRIGLGSSASADGWLEQVNWLPVVTIDTHTFVLNVAMTVPLGMLAPLVVRVRSARGAALVGLGVSAGIEGLQLLGNVVLGSGRVVDVNDVLANTAGAVLGWLLLQALRRDTEVDRMVDSLVLRAEGPTSKRAPALTPR